MYNNFPSNQPYYYGYGYNPYTRPAMPVQDAANSGPQQTQAPIFPPQQAPAQNYIKGRPVVSIDEARASQIDLDGSLYVFPDLGNKKIYTKQINLDGTAAFNVFSLEQAPAASTEPAPLNYVTKEELAVILDQFKESLATPKTTSTKALPPINF